MSNRRKLKQRCVICRVQRPRYVGLVLTPDLRFGLACTACYYTLTGVVA